MQKLKSHVRFETILQKLHEYERSISNTSVYTKLPFVFDILSAAEVLAQQETTIYLYGPEKWVQRYRRISSLIHKGKITVEDTSGLEPLQSNYGVVVEFLSLYGPIDRDMKVADIVEREIKKRNALSKRILEAKRKGKIKDKELVEWAGKRRITLDNGVTLSSRSASVRHALNRQREREALMLNGLTREQANLKVDKRGKGYARLDERILREVGYLTKRGNLVKSKRFPGSA